MAPGSKRQAQAWLASSSQGPAGLLSAPTWPAGAGQARMTGQFMHSDSNSREDFVVTSLLAFLNRSGIAAQLIERPDRLREEERTFPAITSDSLFRITSRAGPTEWWACDVMVLASPFSHAQILDIIHDGLNPLANAQEIDIYIEGSFASVATATDQEAAARREAHGLLATVRQAASGTTAGSIAVAELQAEWKPTAGEPSVNLAIVLPNPSASLVQQMASTLGRPLRKKATEQAVRATRVGCSAVVLLDWRGHAEVRQGTHWLARHPQTVAQAVHEVLSEVRSALSAVLLLDHDEEWHILQGAFPGFDE